MSRGKDLVNNTIILGIGSLLPKLTQLIVLPIYTAMLTKAEYGTYDLINILVSLLIPLITLQIERAAFRFLIDMRGKDESKKIISSVYAFVVVVSIIVLIPLGLFLPSAEGNIRILILIYLFIDILISVTRQVVRGLGNNKSYSISAIIQSLSNLILAVLLLSLLNLGLSGLLMALTLSVLVSLIYLLSQSSVFNHISFVDIEKKYLKDMLSYSLPMVPNSISIWIVSLSDRMIVTAFLGVEANAVYAIANKFPNLIKLVYGNFGMAWQESASLASNDADVESYYSKVFEHLYNLIIGVTAVLIASTPILFSLLVRGSYDEAYFQIPILYLGIFFSTISSFYGGVYVALKETKKIGYASIAVAVLNIVINLLFIKQIGIYAASISTLISYFLLVIYRVYDLNKFIRINYKWKMVVAYFSLITLMAFISYQRVFMLDIINFIFGCIFAFAINLTLVKRMVGKVLKRK